jgi:outer membrane protein OmpA-like peptidoglycan-associated protein
MRYKAFRTFVGVLSAALLMGATAYAQDAPTGKLKIHVNPEEAYTFVDGQAYGPGDHTIVLPAGDHSVMVANYGFTFHTENVSLEPNGVSRVRAELQRSGGPVSGPRGRIQIETGGAFSTKAAVLLNGKKPEYFVGHVDEFNNDIIFKQELIVPPGKHLVTITHHGTEIWSGVLEVGENQRVILDASNGKQKVKDWPRGTQFGDLPRFKAGAVSTTVVIAPVSGNIAATPSRIDCNQPSQLAWNSRETIDADITNLSPVPVSGEKTVSPRQTTTYEFTATGPGGVTKSSTTLQVNPVVTATLAASPTEVRYRKIGDKVIQQGSTNLNWTSTNSDAASLAPLGSVPTSGAESVMPVPAQTSYGPVNEDVKYTLKATNVCGGSEMKTVAVHMTGAIEPIPEVALHSVFFPTDYPMKSNPSLGLLDSQRKTLATLAAGFTKYLEYDPDAKLALVAHADTRGAAKFNMELAERRVDIVKAFLISQGIAADKITTTAVGEEQPLDKETVATLESQNPNPAPAARARNAAGMQLAYQRRVDITLLPKKAESKRFYPNGAPDSQILWQLPTPSRSMVEKEQ